MRELVAKNELLKKLAPAEALDDYEAIEKKLAVADMVYLREPLVSSDGNYCRVFNELSEWIASLRRKNSERADKAVALPEKLADELARLVKASAPGGEEIRKKLTTTLDDLELTAAQWRTLLDALTEVYDVVINNQ